MPPFTKNAIKESFLKLLDQKPLSQITVKDIVEDCGISRNSFYYHFADVPALITEIIKEQVDSAVDQYGRLDSLEDCMVAMVRYAKEHRRMVMHMYRSVSREMVEDYLQYICRYTVEKYLDAIVKIPIPPEDRETLLCFYQCECFGQAAMWLSSGMNYDIEGRLGRFCRLMRGMTETFIRRSIDDAEGKK